MARGDPAPVVYVIEKREPDIVAIERPPPRTPYFCGFMVLVNIVAFIYSIYMNDWRLEPASTNPMFGPSAQTLQRMGAKDTYLIVDCKEVWRLLSAQILHGGIIHLLFNMWALWDVGAGLERHFGPVAVAVIYLLSGLAGNAASCIFLPDAMTVGASGAIFGLFGAMWADFMQNYHTSEFAGNRCSTLLCLSFCTLFSLALGLVPFVDNFAHVGGFIAGILCGCVLLADTSEGRETLRASWSGRSSGSSSGSSSGRCCGLCCSPGVRQLVVGVAAAVVLVGYVVVLYVSLFESHDLHAWCSWCERVNCLETDWWDCDADSASSCSDAEIQWTDGLLNASVTCLDGRVNYLNQVNITALAKPGTECVVGSASAVPCQFTSAICTQSGSLGEMGCLSNICS
jgi:membrane associated rhomboid family serine protease